MHVADKDGPTLYVRFLPPEIDAWLDGEAKKHSEKDGEKWSKADVARLILRDAQKRGARKSRT